jgi:DNA primase
MEKERERALLGEGRGAQIKVSYSQGGQKALGVAFAEQQLVAILLKKPEYISQVRERLHPENFLDVGMGRACALILEKSARGEATDLPSLAGELPDETLALISRVLAQNYDAGFSAQDMELFVQRLENSLPVSSRAADTSANDLAAYLTGLGDKLKAKKQTPEE